MHIRLFVVTNLKFHALQVMLDREDLNVAFLSEILVYLGSVIVWLYLAVLLVCLFGWG